MKLATPAEKKTVKVRKTNKLNKNDLCATNYLLKTMIFAAMVSVKCVCSCKHPVAMVTPEEEVVTH